MSKFKELLKSYSTEEIVKSALKMEGPSPEQQLADIANKTGAARYQYIVETLKTLEGINIESEYGIVVMYMPINPSFSNSDIDVCVYGYCEDGSNHELYDISCAKWEEIMNMEISESSLVHLLPVDVIAAIVREIASDNETSPKSSDIRQITEDDFSRNGAYQALGVPDDRTEPEKYQDYIEAQRDFAEIKAAVFKFLR